MLRKVVIITVGFVAAAVVYSCRNGKTVDFAAANQAKTYYELLTKEKYGPFVAGMYLPEQIQPTANAFLMLCFGDSTIEEVVVPMVKHEGKWLMK